MDFTTKVLLAIGVVFIIAGLAWHFTNGQIPFGKLPGDIRIEGENTKFYFPLTTSLLLSLILSLILWICGK